VPADLRIVSSPIHLTGRRPLAQLAVLVAVDVLVRRARAEGRHTCWTPSSLAGDLAGQHVVERELGREGLSRDALGREEFEERVRQNEISARRRLAADVAALGLDADLESGALDGEASVRAARTAFVRLFEQGLIDEAERVVDVCTRCATVVDSADAEAAEVEGERLVVRFGDLDVPLWSPELLPGVVAVGVPPAHPLASRWLSSPPTTPLPTSLPAGSISRRGT
jgi:valyl-tRNA synthetase